MRLFRFSVILGAFVFSAAFGLMGGNAFAWHPYCPQPGKSAAAAIAASLTSNAMSLVSIQKQNILPAAVERKISRRVRRWIHAGCPGAFTGEGAERVWSLSPMSVGGVANRMRENAYLVGYTHDGLMRACFQAKEEKEAREREASLNKKLELLLTLVSRMDDRLEKLERNQ